ncbi:MAG: hypothetical protein NT027_04245 [Proteobacteria bacterium]|nr:hypothetical protein [Pseudomonadota bacterium]
MKIVFLFVFLFHLVAFWRLLDKMCSKRMKAAIPLWLCYYNAESLNDDIRTKPLNFSTSLSDRLLRPSAPGDSGVVIYGAKSQIGGLKRIVEEGTNGSYSEAINPYGPSATSFFKEAKARGGVVDRWHSCE